MANTLDHSLDLVSQLLKGYFGNETPRLDKKLQTHNIYVSLPNDLSQLPDTLDLFLVVPNYTNTGQCGSIYKISAFFDSLGFGLTYLEGITTKEMKNGFYNQHGFKNKEKTVKCNYIPVPLDSNYEDHLAILSKISGSNTSGFYFKDHLAEHILFKP